MLKVVRRHRLVLPTDLALVVRTIAMSEEGVGAEIDPSFQLAALLLPLFRRAA